MSKPLGRLRKAWNAFKATPPDSYSNMDLSGNSSSYRLDRTFRGSNSEKSIMSTIFNKISIDVANLNVKHVKINPTTKERSDVESGLAYCLHTEANIDQTSAAFIRDVVISMFDEGTVAVVPIETSANIVNENTFDIYNMRTGRIKRYYPQHVEVEVYNEKVGRLENIVLPKKSVAIIENPLFEIMNQPNSTLQRLVQKLNLLDASDARLQSGKLDIIIKLPTPLKTESQKSQAEARKRRIEEQLEDSAYGIAYIDSAEQITQLNRPAENNLQAQVETLTRNLYNQLGLTENVINGTADEKEMLNYHNSTIVPIVSAITDEFQRKFLTKTARTQGQKIIAYKDPFKLVPIGELAEFADKFTRNEILTSNEIRDIIGFERSPDPKADELRNSNINQGVDEAIDAEYEEYDSE